LLLFLFPQKTTVRQRSPTTERGLSTTSFLVWKQIVVALKKTLSTPRKTQFHKGIKTKYLAKLAFHSICENARGLQGVIPTVAKTMRVPLQHPMYTGKPFYVEAASLSQC
jgi:hypothetical protein